MQEMKSAVEKLSMPFLRTESRRRARSIGMRAYAPKAAEAAIRATARSGRSMDDARPNITFLSGIALWLDGKSWL